MLIYQNLAYCRYIQIWFILYISNVITSSPIVSLFCTSILHLYNINLSSKKIFILLQDYILIYTIFYKIKNHNIIQINPNITNFDIIHHNYNFTDFNLQENIIFFIIYIKVLFLFDVNPIRLYTVYLNKDDNKYKHENFIKYFFRIWYLFIFDKILFNKFSVKKSKKIYKINNKI